MNSVRQKYKHYIDIIENIVETRNELLIAKIFDDHDFGALNDHVRITFHRNIRYIYLSIKDGERVDYVPVLLTMSDTRWLHEVLKRKKGKKRA